MNEINEVKTGTSEEMLACPSCGSSGISTIVTQQEFTYGSGSEAADLTATVNVHRCLKCGIEFLDDSAEDAKHLAVCRHLNVLSPSHIRSLRENRGLSRSDFAGITKLGEATLGRWERGALIQNAAYDQFLYLLSIPGNIEHLVMRNERNRSKGDQPIQVGSQDESSRFRALSESDIERGRERGSKFVLCTGRAA